MLRSRVIYTVFVLLIGIANSALGADNSAEYVGNWLREMPGGFEYIALQPQGHCMWAGGENSGGAFIGFKCLYTVSGTSISITDQFDDHDTPQKIEQPQTFEFVADRDILHPITNIGGDFHRTAKTPEQIYIDKMREGK